MCIIINTIITITITINIIIIRLASSASFAPLTPVYVDVPRLRVSLPVATSGVHHPEVADAGAAVHVELALGGAGKKSSSCPCPLLTTLLVRSFTHPLTMMHSAAQSNRSTALIHSVL